MKNLLKICGLLLVLSSCYNDKADKLYVDPKAPVICETTNITYVHDIAPILQAKCATSGCHDGSGGTSAPYNLNTYQGAYLAYKSATLIDAIEQNGSVPAMPQNAPKLSSCDIDKIATWVADGAQNN